MEILESWTSLRRGVLIDACLEAVPAVVVDSDLLGQCLLLPGRLLLDHDEPNEVRAELYLCRRVTPVTKNDLDLACFGLRAPKAASLFSSLEENEAPVTSISVVETRLKEFVDVEAGEEGAKWILSVASVDKFMLLQDKFRTFIPNVEKYE